MENSNFITITREEFYDYVGSIGGYYGESFKLLLSAKLGEQTAISTLKAPEAGPAAESVFLDSLISTAHVFGMSSGMRGSSVPLALPAGLANFSMDLQPSETYQVETIAKGREGNIESFDIKAITTDGKVVADLKDIKFSRIALARSDSRNLAAASLIHQVKWRAISHSNKDLPKTLYVSGSVKADAEKWCESINEFTDSNAIYLDFNQGASVNTITDSSYGFIYVSPANDSWKAAGDNSPMDVAVDVFQWQQFITEINADSFAIAITENAQYIPTSSVLPNPTSAACWASAGSIVNGTQRNALTVLDLHGDPSEPDKIKALNQSCGLNEKFVLFKEGQLHKLEIERVNQESLVVDKFKLDLAGSNVLVTGASGALASHIIEWAGQEDVSTVTALSRSGITPPSRLAAKHKINAVKGSISDKRLWDTVSLSDHLFIFHLAGENPADPLESIKTKASKAFEAKYFGTLNLVNSLNDANAAHLVIFSSVAAIAGATDQLFYAAANAASGAAAIHLLHATPHKVDVLQLGSWQGGGMAEDAHLQKLINAKGLEYLKPWEALRAISIAMHRGELLTTIAAFNENYGFNVVEESGGDEIATNTAQTQLVALASLEDSAKLKVVLDEIRAQAALSLETDVDSVETDADLFDMGFDSLMALEMRNALSKKYDVKINLNILMGARTLEDLAIASLPVIKVAIEASATDKQEESTESSLVL